MAAALEIAPGDPFVLELVADVLDVKTSAPINDAVRVEVVSGAIPPALVEANCPATFAEMDPVAVGGTWRRPVLVFAAGCGGTIVWEPAVDEVVIVPRG